MNSREALLRQVQIYDFALNDTALYLNLHPDDRVALDYYNRYKKLHDDAVAQFNQAYGPLARWQVTDKRWQWVDEPWPWESEA